MVNKNIKKFNMESIHSVIKTFDTRLSDLSISYSALQKRIGQLDNQLQKKNVELQRSLEETSRLRNLLDSILQSINDAVIAVDDNGIICMVNRAANSLLEIEGQTLMGRLHTQVFSERSPSVIKSNAENYSHEAIQEEWEIVTSQGNRKIVESTVSLLLPKDEQPISAVQVIRDITESKKLERELKRAEIFEALTRMANFFADEIRNPLGGITANLAKLQQQNHSKDAEEILTSIQNCVQRLTDLVSDMHILTRPVKPTFVRTELCEFVANVVEYFFVEHQNVHYSINLPEMKVEVNIDPILLQQAFMNILSNAIDAISDGDEITITLQKEQRYLNYSGEMVTLIVEDSGCGMNSKIQEKLFTPFFTTKESGKGLGLTIARNFVRFHNGDITVNSKEGKGTKVKIYLNIS